MVTTDFISLGGPRIPAVTHDHLSRRQGLIRSCVELLRSTTALLAAHRETWAT